MVQNVHNRGGNDGRSRSRKRNRGRGAGGYQIAGGGPKSNRYNKTGGEAEVLSLLCLQEGL
nr:MAG TPA: hypothetical protein [Caudoviricetes sp.]